MVTEGMEMAMLLTSVFKHVHVYQGIPNTFL